MRPADYSILVLEDEPAILRLVTASLQAAGFEKISAQVRIAGARNAWQAEGSKFDLFLTDFSLPDGSATAFIQELLASRPDLAVVIMTGFSEEALCLDDTVRRAVTVVQKPFRPSDLCNALLARLERLAAA